MAEGKMGQENLNEMEQTVDKAKNATTPLANKAIDATANKLADHFGKDSQNPKNPKKQENPAQKQNKNNQDSDSMKDSLKDMGNNSAVNGNGKDALNHLKNGAKHHGAAGGSVEAGAKAAGAKAMGGINGKGIAAGIGDKATEAIKNTGRINNGEASGDIVDTVTDKAVDTAKDAVKAGVAAAKIAASGGTDVKAWIDFLKSGGLKFLVLGLVFTIGLPILLIFILIFIMGGMISEAFTKLSETFTALSENLNPTAYESFTMEAQYEILADAFGDEVYRAYQLMLEDVDNEISVYADDVTYNEWGKILEWSKSKGQIDYSTIYSFYDSAMDSTHELGMPDATVYIGGYTGDVDDDEWGVNGVNNTVDEASKTNPNYNKGLLKDGKTLNDSDCYATGNEVFFDEDSVRESVQASAGYAAISDMAYLVSGYNVAMMEAPIIEFGTKVTVLQKGTTIIKYKLDIAGRIFMNTLDANIEKYGDSVWADAAGAFDTVATYMKDSLAQIFNGETTYFTYDASLIEVVENDETRTVYEYSEKLYTVQEQKFKYTVTYKDGGDECAGTHSCEEVECTESLCGGNHTITGCTCAEPTEYEVSDEYTPSHEDYINAATYDSAPNITGYDYIEEIAQRYSNYDDVNVEYVGAENVGDEYPLNRSKYIETEKSYTKYTLDIPMSAFDVDRILKAIFETSPYYGELTYYYTDHDSTYGKTVGDTDYSPTKIDTEDSIINKYGKYIGEWKYAYYDKSITYTGEEGTFTEDYSEGDVYDNGINQQPYFQQDEVYIYTCECTPSYGIYAKCPDCGASAQRSSDIGADGTGERPLTYIGTTIVQQGGYFSAFILNDSDSWNSIKQSIKQNTCVAMTTTSKEVIDDYTGGQVGGTTSSTGTGGMDLNLGTGSGSTDGLAGTTPISSLVGSTNTEKTWNFLISKGLTPAQAAGVMGNIQHESCFNPGIQNSIGAYGICQWLGGRKQNLISYCASNGFSYASLEGQLNFMWYELNGSERRALSMLMGTSTAQEASNSFGKYYERFGNDASIYAKRVQYSQSFFATNGVSAGVASASGDGVESLSITGNTSFATAGSSYINVVLTDEDGNEYYPITVMERILEIKNSCLKVLENCDEIQAEWATVGSSYDQRYTEGIQSSPMAEYVANLVKDTESYTNITTLNNGKIAIGIGSWQGNDAASLLRKIIEENPDEYILACEDAGIEEIDFSTNWNDSSNQDFSKIKKVIEKLLEVGRGEQDTLFQEKVQEIVTYFINYQVTDPATLALLSATAMFFEDINTLSSAGGTMATFREYVVLGSISAGADNSFATAYSALYSWLSDSGNEYSSQALIDNVNSFYNVIAQDNASGTLPWIGTGELTPENVQPIIDLASKMTESPYKERFTYSQSGRYTISRFAETLTSLYNTGEGYIIGDCSSFIAALYYCFGYNVPTSSGSWQGNSYGYIQRTDFANMQPGDVIVWRNSDSGHVELYIGDGKSIGFGCAPPRVHNWSCFYSDYHTVSFYRIVE